MLSKADEYPFHQTPDPIAYAGSDRNFYDRYWFGGYTKDRSLYFAVAFGLYPQLDIMDASFCVLWKGKQHNLRASKHMLGERSVLTVGPISIEILSPLQSSRITVNDEASGIKAELTFDARTPPIEEPRFTRRIGTRAFMDYTRMTQNVTWRGHISVAGEQLELSANNCWGTRDRSWGIRPVGAADSQPPAGGDFGKQFFWMWTPVNFDQHVGFAHTNDDAYGRPWNRRAVIQGINSDAQEFEEMEYDFTWRPNSRRIDTLTCRFQGENTSAVLRFKTENHFYMSGLGYFHPQWGHGKDQGPLAVEYDVVDVSQVDGSNPLWWHIQALSSVQMDIAGETYHGVGLLEQMFIGAHEPTGMGEDFGPAKGDKA